MPDEGGPRSAENPTSGHDQEQHHGLEDDQNGCKHMPGIWTDFVNAFVDHTVGGHVLSRRTVTAHGSTLQEKSTNASEASTYLPAAERVVAVGDVHGDVSKLRDALKGANLIDEQDRWIGKSTVLVQVGDQLDRGGQELQVLYLLEKLRREAPRYGGEVHVLLGNHETANIEGWFRYATPSGFREFQKWAAWERIGNGLKVACHGVPKVADPLSKVPPHVPSNHRARFAALVPGGQIAERFLSHHKTVLVLGGTVFVHGGVLPEHVEYGLEKINSEARDWVLGKSNVAGQALRGPEYFHSERAIVWSRKYSLPEEEDCDCRLLERTLRMVKGAERMVVGHTIQDNKGINLACKDMVARVDVGMSKGCGDRLPQVLEIRKDSELRVLSPHGPPRALNELQNGRSLMGMLRESLLKI